MSKLHPNLIAACDLMDARTPGAGSDLREVLNLKAKSDTAKATYEARKRLVAHARKALARGSSAVQALQALRDEEAALEVAALNWARAMERYARADDARSAMARLRRVMGVR